ncbi:MAG: hypothetical protein V1770_02295 [bacterium]
MKIFKTTPKDFPYEGVPVPILVPAKNKASAGKKGQKEWKKWDRSFQYCALQEIKVEELEIKGYEIILRKKEVK